MRKIMACLDVGSDSVKLVVGEMVKKQLNVLAVAESSSNGVKNGLVEDPNALLSSLKEVIHKCESVIGLSVRQMIVSVPAIDASFQVVNGSIQITNEGNMIEGKDIIRVMQKAIKSQVVTDLEYITMMPTSFTLDDNRVVKDPKGLTSKVLAVRGVMVSTPKANIYPILACLERLGIDVLDIVLAPIGDYFEFRTKETDKNVGAIINIGSDVTTISIFNKGVLTNTNSILLGGQNIDNDIAFVYKTSVEGAKSLKENYALATKDKVDVKEKVEIQDKNGKIIEVTQSEVSEIVESRLQEILNLSTKEINHLTKKEISYIIFTGGVTECRDFKQVLEKTYVTNFVLGNIKEMGARNNKYSTCLGLIKYYAYNAKLKDKDYSIFSIDEQQLLSGANFGSEDESVIGKLFGYIFNG